MKKLLFIALILTAINTQAQHSCCQSTLAFQELADDPQFIASHDAPEPFDFTPRFGKMVSLKTSDGNEAHAFEARQTLHPNKIILMFHEYWGLNNYIKQEAENLAEETGCTVLALDLYDGKVTDKPNEAGELMQSASETRVRTIIDAGLKYATPGQVQTIGWCMGGGWSMQAAIAAQEHAVGCIIYYGMPEMNDDKLATLHAPVLAFFGTQDKWINPDVVSQWKTKMESLKKPVEIYSYDADHAFANPSNPKHNKTATIDAHKKALAFIKANFGFMDKR